MKGEIRKNSEKGKSDLSDDSYDKENSINKLDVISTTNQNKRYDQSYVTINETISPENVSYVREDLKRICKNRPSKDNKDLPDGPPKGSVLPKGHTPSVSNVLPKGLPPLKSIVNVDFDDVLQQLGEFGLFQKLMFLSMLLFAFAEAFVYFAQIFITVIPDHWCRVPELSHLNHEQRKLLSIPQKGNSYDSCRVFSVNYSQVLELGIDKSNPAWPTTPCQHGWDYDFSTIPYSSIATELDWVCDQSTFTASAQATFFLGAIVGGLVFGWVSDHFGRIPALMGSNLVSFVFGTLTAFSTSFWQFTICRFFVGMGFDNCFTLIYILVLEYVGPNWRTFVANMSIAVFFSLAESLLPWIAYYVSHWQWLCFVTSLPLLAGVFIAWIVPESARWLVSQDRVEEAVIIMKKLEKVNKKKVDPKLYHQLEETCLRLAAETKEQKRFSVLDLFKTPRIRKVTFLLIFVWMAMALLFDGHVRQVEHLGLDFFLTFTLASATELPADTLLTFTLDRWGRRWYACVSLILSGVFSLLSCSVETGVLSVGLALVGRFLVDIAYNIGLQYSAELMPTVLRGQGVTFIHMMGHVASMLSPYVVHLSVIDPMLPLAVLGIIGILAGGLCLFLPETMGQDLPQTLQDFENFGRHQKFLDFPCTRRNSDKEDCKVEEYIETKTL